MKMFLLARFLRLRGTYRNLLRELASYSEHEPPTSALIVPIFVKSPAVYRKSSAKLGRPGAPPQRDVWL